MTLSKFLKPPQKKSNLIFFLCCYFSNFINVPYMVLMTISFCSFSRFSVALISQFPIAINGSITTPSKFVTY